MTARNRQFYSAAVAFLCAAASTHYASAANVDIEWQNKESYSDLGGPFDDASVKEFAKSIEQFLEKETKNRLPDGATLRMSVTDVDLAGEIEPWQEDATDVRIVRDVYPPKMTFEYTVESGDGEVLDQGTARLIDSDFNYTLGRRIFSDDAFRYEKQMLDEWLRNELDVPKQ